jgi:hypothetical protein
MHQDECDQEDRAQHREPDQIQRPIHRRRQHQVSERREADDEADAQQQIAADLDTTAR